MRPRSPVGPARWMDRYAGCPEAVLRLDPAWAVIAGNPSAAAFLGRSLEELCPGPFEAVVDPFSWPKACAMLAAAQEAGFTSGWELNLLGAHAVRLALCSAQATEDGGVAIFFKDATPQMATTLRLIETNEAIDQQNQLLEKVVAERTRELVEINRTLEARVAERTSELAAEKRRFEAILQSSADGIIATDGAGRITGFNPAIAQLSGLLPEQALGQALGTILPGLELRAGASFDYREFDLPHAHTGHVVPVSVSIAPLASASGEGWVLVIRDNRVVKAIERQREDFIAMLAHDLKTPVLAAIKATEYLREGVFGTISSAQADVFATMLDSHRRMLRMINALLDVYRYEAGQKQLHLAAVSVAALADRCAAELKALLDDGAIALSLEVAPELRVFGDELELERLLVNLLSNAIAHSPAGSVIRVRADEADGMVCLEVVDQGSGLSAADQERLFERFVQATPRAAGTGLGLYLCRQIAQAHGGSIGVESRLGAGSRFWVRLLSASEEEPHGAPD